MRILRRVILYAVPVLSILMFAYYSFTAGGPHAEEWGALHGVNVAIVENYGLLNCISMLAWLFVLGFVLGQRISLARSAAIFAVAYVLCDVVFYLPMARLAGEHFPFDQATILTVQAVYAISFQKLMGGGPVS
jgi:hypothetical protein